MQLTESAKTWKRLSAKTVEPARFDVATLDSLPAPARRLLTRAIPPGTALHTTFAATMNGHIKLGPLWRRFNAKQVLRAGDGLVWQPDIGGRLLRITGADTLDPDGASMQFRLHGRIRIVDAGGPDVTRSAAGRLAGETVLFVPQALTPQAGATWTGIDDTHAVVTLSSENHHLPDVGVTVNADGDLESVLLARWNTSAKPPAEQPFGGPVSERFVTTDGIRIAGTGAGGWHWGTTGWNRGEFFRYRLLEAHHS